MIVESCLSYSFSYVLFYIFDVYFIKCFNRIVDAGFSIELMKIRWERLISNSITCYMLHPIT